MKHAYNTLTVSCEESKIVSVYCFRKKKTFATSALSRFPVKLICSITFGSASSIYC